MIIGRAERVQRNERERERTYSLYIFRIIRQSRAHQNPCEGVDFFVKEKLDETKQRSVFFGCIADDVLCCSIQKRTSKTRTSEKL